MNTGQGIVFVCLGNICRSPLAEVVARKEFARHGLDIAVDSCGTGSWHIGEGADPRSVQAAAEAGYNLRPHRARQLDGEDFSRWRWLLAMDRANLRDLRRLAPDHQVERVGLFLEVAGVQPGGDVPDPYYGDIEDFRHMVRLVQQGVAGLVERLRAG